MLIVGQSKSTLGTSIRHVIAAIGTARNFEQCLRDFLNWRVTGRLGLDAPVARVDLELYLSQESLRWRQKTVDQHRQALSLIYFVEMAHFEAGVRTITAGRACPLHEMELVATRLDPRNALGTRLAFH